MIVMFILSALVLGLLVMVESIRPRRDVLNRFELNRRVKQDDKVALATVRRETLLSDILSLQRIVSALLLVIFTVLSVATFGWFIGIVVALIVALEAGALARVALWQRHFQHLYEQYEDRLLHFVETYAKVFTVIRSVLPEPTIEHRLESREELLHLVDHSIGLLSAGEKKLIHHGLSFEAKKVSEIMTPRSVIDCIDKKELLGPLVLDDLHKTGHSRFPVTDGDIDHVVGVLHIQDLFTLDTKRSTTAEKAMEARVFYIHEDQTLQHALAAFIRTHHHLFVVVNEYRETVGLLSLEDVTEVLLGRKIIDEFDTHEDLRLVALRDPDNNDPTGREDV